MILYCIVTYLMTIGFIIEGENLRDFKVIWLIYALLGPVFIPILLGVFISDIADYMRTKRSNIWKKKD